MVGKNIKKLRVDKSMTQDDLACELNVTRQAVSNWEIGRTSPDIDTLTRLAEVFEVSVEELIYGRKSESGSGKEPTSIIKFEHITKHKTVKQIKKGLSFGSALAMVISFCTWKSIKWAILHGLLGWGYVVYYVLKYGLS